jgi:hypothetical protein
MTVRELRQALCFLTEQDKTITLQEICLIMKGEQLICPVCGEELNCEIEWDQE